MHTLELTAKEQETLVAALLSRSLAIQESKALANKSSLFGAVDVLEAQSLRIGERIGAIYTMQDSNTGVLEFNEADHSEFTYGLNNLTQRLTAARLLVTGIKRVDDLICEQIAEAARLAGRFYALGESE